MSTNTKTFTDQEQAFLDAVVERFCSPAHTAATHTLNLDEAAIQAAKDMGEPVPSGEREAAAYMETFMDGLMKTSAAQTYVEAGIASANEKAEANRKAKAIAEQNRMTSAREQMATVIEAAKQIRPLAFCQGSPELDTLKDVARRLGMTV